MGRIAYSLDLKLTLGDLEPTDLTSVDVLEWLFEHWNCKYFHEDYERLRAENTNSREIKNGEK